MSQAMSRSKALALIAAAVVVGLLVGGAFGALLLPRQASPRGPNVEFTGNVSIPNAVSLRFHHSGSNMTLDSVLPVTGSSEVKGALIGGFSYNITAYASGLTVICNSAVYVPAVNATFTATIVCG